MKPSQPDALIVTVAQTIGQLSGLPFFKNTEAVWEFYPPSKKLELEYNAVIHPGWFDIKPGFAWGFYGQRSFQLAKPTSTKIFELLKEINEALPLGIGLLTTSVNGEFVKNGLPNDCIEELYGNIHKLQCSKNCHDAIWDLDLNDLSINPKNRMADQFPKCPKCNAPARPNVLMFDDHAWNPKYADAQRDRMNDWIGTLTDKKVHVLELGVDTVDPSMELTSVGLSEKLDAQLFQVHPKELNNQIPAIEEGLQEYRDLILKG